MSSITLSPPCRLFVLDVVHHGCVPSERFPNFDQAELDRHTFIDYTPFNPAVKTTVSYVKENSDPDAPFKNGKGLPHMLAACCHNHTEFKAVVDPQCSRSLSEAFPP